MNEHIRKLALQKGYKLSDISESINFYEDLMALININMRDAEDGKAKLIYMMQSEREFQEYIFWLLHRRSTDF